VPSCESGPFSITGSGTHTIRWKYIKGGSGSSGSDCLWIDNVRWSGAMPDVNEIEYVYDLSGRRIEKKRNGVTQLKFLYDGDHILAEYDANDTLLRKYVHGPCIDEPICMIESSGTYAGTQYYHYDALGSVVALTDPNGDVVQLYEYSVYGQVAASDANHPNRFMFTGREFDKDTGLYYYRARYYNPEIGRFLQTDPIGYGDGMNLYRYCESNPLLWTDPSGEMTSWAWFGFISDAINAIGDAAGWIVDNAGGYIEAGADIASGALAIGAAIGAAETGNAFGAAYLFDTGVMKIATGAAKIIGGIAGVEGIEDIPSTVPAIAAYIFIGPEAGEDVEAIESIAIGLMPGADIPGIPMNLERLARTAHVLEGVKGLLYPWDPCSP